MTILSDTRTPAQPDQIGPLPDTDGAIRIVARFPGQSHTAIVRLATRAIYLHPGDTDRLAEFMASLRSRLDATGDMYCRDLFLAILGNRAIGLGILAYCRLSPPERARRRAAVGTHRRYRTANQPPSARQLRYLADLGSAACPKTRREAAEVIRECRSERRGRDGQW